MTSRETRQVLERIEALSKQLGVVHAAVKNLERRILGATGETQPSGHAPTVDPLAATKEHLAKTAPKELGEKAAEG